MLDARRVPCGSRAERKGRLSLMASKGPETEFANILGDFHSRHWQRDFGIG